MLLLNLRELSVVWNNNALHKLLETNEKCENLIFKGWSDKETYGQNFSEEFQKAAVLRAQQRTIDEETAMADLRELANSFHVDPEMPDINHKLRQKKLRKQKQKIDTKITNTSKLVHCERILPSDIAIQTEKSNYNANNNEKLSNINHNNGIHAMRIGETDEVTLNDNKVIEDDKYDNDIDINSNCSSDDDDSDSDIDNLKQVIENYRTKKRKTNESSSDLLPVSSKSHQPVDKVSQIDNEDNDPYNVYVGMSTIFQKRANKIANIAQGRTERAQNRSKKI